MMKQGVKRLLVPKSVVWKGVSKKFSILYNGKWLRTIEAGSSTNTLANLNRPSSSSTTTNISKTTYCCLSREDVIRFLIGCLGALAPIPLSSISSLEAINPHYSSIEASLPAREISACKLWKCDYLAAAYALANLSAGQFVMGVEDNISPRLVPDLRLNSGDNNTSNGSVGPMRLRRFSSRSLGFFGNAISPTSGSGRSMYRGRSAPLTCKETSSLAAVMAQMLSHRATHVWVTEGDDDVLAGVVGYGEIMHAVTNKPPSTAVPSNT